MPGKLAIIAAKSLAGVGLNGPRRLHYHLGRANFGDDINPWLFGRIAGRPFRWGAVGKSHFLGVGSIAARCSSRSVIMGSGLIEPAVSGALTTPAEVFALRGEHTAEAFGGRCAWLGDPVSLIDLLVAPAAVAAMPAIGLIPHATEVAGQLRRLRDHPGIRVIDPRGDPLEVVREVTRCRAVASQSLHGLIVADAFGIPNLWIAPSRRMVGGTFKFRDYFTTVDRPLPPVALEDFLAWHPPSAFSVGRYRWDKPSYLEAMRARLAVGGGDP